MKAGDLVMFKPEGTYAKWFAGKFGIIESLVYSKNGRLYFRVKWLQPVKYGTRNTPFSDFAADRFEVFSESR